MYFLDFLIQTHCVMSSDCTDKYWASCSKHLIWIKMIRIWKLHFFLFRIR